MSVTDTATGQILACYKTVIDAQKHRSILEGTGVANDDDDCRSVEPSLVVLPPTVAW